MLEGYSREMWEKEKSERLKSQEGYDVKEEIQVNSGQETGDG